MFESIHFLTLCKHHFFLASVDKLVICKHLHNPYLHLFSINSNNNASHYYLMMEHARFPT